MKKLSTFLALLCMAGLVYGDTCFVPVPLPAAPAVVLPNPNILVVLGDDAGITSMPFMQELASLGANFVQHHSGPICSLSRGDFLTGRSSLRHPGTKGAIELGRNRGLVATEITLPEYLKAAGYSTYFVGKWHLGSLSAAFRPNQQGVDEASWSSLGVGVNTTDWWEQDTQVEVVTATNKIPFAQFRNSSGPRTVDKALEYIATAASPYYLQVNTLSMHIPLPCAHQNLATSETLAQCSEREMDEAAATVVRAALDRDPNTFVLYFTDNGRTDGYPGLRGVKTSWYEGGLRTSAVLYGPGIAPQTIDEPVILTDWLPTLLHLVGAPAATAVLDGVDLAPVLAGNPRPSSYMITEGYYREGCLKRVGWVATSQTFDLCADPGETTPITAPADFLSRAAARKAITK